MRRFTKKLKNKVRKDINKIHQSIKTIKDKIKPIPKNIKDGTQRLSINIKKSTSKIGVAIKYNKEACSKKDVTRLSLSKKTRNYTFNSSSKILSIKEDVIEGIKGKNEEKKDKNKNE